MSFRRKTVQQFRRKDAICRDCRPDGHPEVAHYKADGSCVIPNCGCKQFKPAGNKFGIKAIKKEAESEGGCGHSHRSGAEQKVCFELRLRKKTGGIKDYRANVLQHLLGPSGHEVATHVLDFEVDHLDGTLEKLEVKGWHLQNEGGFKIKWALNQDMHRGNPKVRFTLLMA